MPSKKNLRPANKTSKPKSQKPKAPDTKNIQTTDKEIKERPSNYSFKSVAPDEE